ncbi:MAG: urease accessory protein UreD [Candidatus Dactylopiibacterium sp.]|nr:urease accessory protein UreD [Candidatus Dactylopiibacterium sp.]
MRLDDLPTESASGWHAHLDLLVEARHGRSVLSRNRHEGPLRVQKALYPEGDGVCQILMLHPPAGIAGGDRLRIDLCMAAGAHAQLTTPGAGKWYRSAGPLATQDITLDVAPGATLEWLPQEAILFDQARARATTTLRLAEGGRCIGWDILCLGRQASGERFTQGSFRQRLRLERPDGRPLWQESLHLTGSDAALEAAVALGGHRVWGALWVAGPHDAPALVAALRALDMQGTACGVSALPHVSILRVLAHCAEDARHALEAAWATARPHLLGRAARAPRIWST